MATDAGDNSGQDEPQNSPIDAPAEPVPVNTPATDDSALDEQLRALLAEQNHSANPAAGLLPPDIDTPLAQLGMKLFFSKSLGGELDSACVSCHHPALGGSDRLSLGIGVEAVQPDLVGPGRVHVAGDFPLPRNAPTTFNSGLYRRGLFWDSRIEQLDDGIRTPDSAVGVADPVAGQSLLAAQARFPVTSVEEMRSSRFETGQSNDLVRDHLAARIGGYDGGFAAQQTLDPNRWEALFQTAFGRSESAEVLVNYANIATALSAYQRSQVFIDSPWRDYVNGDATAISADAKRGALLFFSTAQDGGGHCAQCHAGDLFSDERYHLVAFPQIGAGKGDGDTGNDDFGRGRETGALQDRYKFRTPSLLNIALTAPYGHAGSYATLRDVVRHYDQPRIAMQLFDRADWCNDLAQFSTVANCDATFPNAQANTANAQRLLDDQPRDVSIVNINLNNNEIDQIVTFLETLSDRCASDTDCISRWVPNADSAPDNHQLNAIDGNGTPLPGSGL